MYGAVPAGLFPYLEGYIGGGNHEAAFTFETHVDAKFDSRPDNARAREIIEGQLEFLSGPMQFGDQAQAGPRKAHSITILRVDPLPGPAKALAHQLPL